MTKAKWNIASILFLLCLSSSYAVERERSFVSHSPIRPLPIASSRSLGKGPVFYVDAQRGDNRNDGSETKPWKTLAHAVGQMKLGDTLCLRGGTYYEHVKVTARGTEAYLLKVKRELGKWDWLRGSARDVPLQFT